MRPYRAVVMAMTWSGERQLALNVSHLQYSNTRPALPPPPTLSTPATPHSYQSAYHEVISCYVCESVQEQLGQVLARLWAL